MTELHDPKHTRRLVLRCQLGEREAFAELVDAWHPRLWRHLHRTLGSTDAADEVSQEVWLRVVRTIMRLREPGAFPGWLFRIAHGSMTDRLRRQYRAAAHLASAEPTDVTVDVPATLEPDEVEHLHAALADLEPAHREALGLFYLEGFDIREVADALGVPVGTVKSRLHRGRSALRHALEQQGTTP
ncbi:MAG: sigma-70 family RNA polymerase sigma factor [Planctomycetota bacterium]